MEFNKLIEIVKNNQSHEAIEVVAAMDAIAGNLSSLDENQRSIWANELDRLKWHGGYTYRIDNPSQALRDNPGFLADMLMWAGLEAVQKARDDRPSFDTVVDETLKRDKGYRNENH